jgi:hypothetical protein
MTIIPPFKSRIFPSRNKYQWAKVNSVSVNTCQNTIPAFSNEFVNLFKIILQIWVNYVILINFVSYCNFQAKFEKIQSRKRTRSKYSLCPKLTDTFSISYVSTTKTRLHYCKSRQILEWRKYKPKPINFTNKSL